MRNLLSPACAILLLLLASVPGCGGNKILKEPQALELQGPLVVASDSRLAVAFDWVIVRDGPGTWSKNADWDEYLFRLHNLSDNEITIESVVIFDSMETTIESSSDRKQLIRGSKAASKRYEEEDIEVKAGLGGGALVAAGGATAAAGVSALSASLAGATGAVGAAGVLVVAPVLAVGGVIRGINNSKVSREIENRHTHLPMTVSAGDEVVLDIFFPLSPSPVRLQFNYSDTGAKYVLRIDTADVLSGLHLGAPEQEVIAE